MIKTELFLENFHWGTNQDKTYQYCICDPNNQAEFKNLLTHIRKYGYIVKVQGEPFVSLDIGEYLYWTKWNSVKEADFINRVQIDRIGHKIGALKSEIVKLMPRTGMHLSGLYEWIMHPYGFKRPVK